MNIRTILPFIGALGAITALFGVTSTNSFAAVSKSPSVQQRTQNRRLPTARTAGSPAETPIYIKFEAEDFSGVEPEGSTNVSAWSERMPWYPETNRGADSGWYAAFAGPLSNSAAVTEQTYIPESGRYVLWVRYEDYAGQDEPFIISVQQKNASPQAQFGRGDKAVQTDPKIPWSYAWDKKEMDLQKGPATLEIAVHTPAKVRRAVDALILTTDSHWQPENRGFPPMAYSNYLQQWAKHRAPLKPLVTHRETPDLPSSWRLPKISGRDFWYLGADRFVPGYPLPVNLQQDLVKGFVAKHAAKPGAAPIFSAPVTTVRIAISDVKDLLTPDNPMRNYVLKNKKPFVLYGNSGHAGSIANAYQQMNALFGNLWQGIISGENSYLAPALLPPDPPKGRAPKAEIYQWLFGDGAKAAGDLLRKDWNSPIQSPFEKWIFCLSTGTAPHVHQFAEAGAKVLGTESAAALPYVPWQMAFMRGAARQYGRKWTVYFGADFFDAVRTFVTHQTYVLNLEGLSVTDRSSVIGPSLPHIRRVLLNTYLQGASFFFPEQGYDLFDLSGKLNPMGWSYDEMLRLASRHPDRGVVDTPVGVLLDHAHGFDKYGYRGKRPWSMLPLTRGDRMIDEFFNVAYYPFPKNEGAPVNDMGVPWPNGYFGDIFDILVTSPTHMNSVGDYPVLFCAGDTRLDRMWANRLKRYVDEGGTLVLNAEQLVPQFDAAFLGVTVKPQTREAHAVKCLRDGEIMAGTPFSYRLIAPTTATPIARTPGGDPIAVVHSVGKGRVVLTTPSYLLGLDGVAMPYMAHLLLELTSGLLPVEVRGNCEHYLNLTPAGYLVVVSNNEGIVKPTHGPARMERSKVSDISLTMDEQPLATDDWIGEHPEPWSYPNEWLPEYTQPVKLRWKRVGKVFRANFRLLPGELRAFMIHTRHPLRSSG